MKNFILGLTILVAAAAHAQDNLLECRTDGMSHGNHFFLKKDMTLSVYSSGWVAQTLVENSPVTVKEGKIVVQETSVFENEEPVVTTSERKVVQISDVSGQFVLMINREMSSMDYSGYIFSGKIIKGAMELGDEKMDSLYCFGNSHTLDLIN
jgi:hypothetical protein